MSPTHLSPTHLPIASPSSAGAMGVPKTRILVAEDDAISREVICTSLKKWGYEVVLTEGGIDAIMALRKRDAPTLAMLDWMLPGMDGIEICRRVREVGRPVYIIMLTARGGRENLLEGLRAGADEYLVKPFHNDEMHARILVGLRVMAMQSALAERLKACGSA